MKSFRYLSILVFIFGLAFLASCYEDCPESNSAEQQELSDEESLTSVFSEIKQSRSASGNSGSKVVDAGHSTRSYCSQCRNYHKFDYKYLIVWNYDQYPEWCNNCQHYRRYDWTHVAEFMECSYCHYQIYTGWETSRTDCRTCGARIE